jgi:hypothetical protein
MGDQTPREVGKNYLLLTHPFRLVVYVPTALSASPLRNGNLGQTDILHDSPDNGETTGFRGEGINLIGALPHIAKEAFNGIGRANGAMHDRRKRIKSQQVLFIFAQAPDSFRVAQAIFGECSPPD